MEEKVREGEMPDQETLIVISAAIAACLGKNVRIRKVRFIDESAPSAWAMQGRMEIQATRNIRGRGGR